MIYIIDNINNYNDQEYKLFNKEISKISLFNVNHIKNSTHKKRKIIGKKILIDYLKKHNINYEEMIFELNTYKKPYIKNRSIFFNISHSNDYCVCAFSSREIGIDIEKIRTTNLNTVTQFATTKEQKYILENKDCQEERLFEIYTLKEAYLKMIGRDLKNIREVEFEIQKNRIVCSDNRVKIKQIKTIKGYIISICEKIK